MKTIGQVAFEAHQESLEGHGIHGKPGFATTHLQPWGSVSQRNQQAWEAAAAAVVAAQAPCGRKARA